EPAGSNGWGAVRQVGVGAHRGPRAAGPSVGGEVDRLLAGSIGTRSHPPEGFSSPSVAPSGTSSPSPRGAYEPVVPGSRRSEAELVQCRRPVGAGPSGKTWPRWAPQLAQAISSRTMPWLVSRRTTTA